VKALSEVNLYEAFFNPIKLPKRICFQLFHTIKLQKNYFNFSYLVKSEDTDMTGNAQHGLN
jgi:hypothetical protein